MMHRTIGILFILLIFFSQDIYAVKTRVVLLSGGKPELREQIEYSLTEVLNHCNRRFEMQTSLQAIRPYFNSAKAYQDFISLVQVTNLHAMNPEYQTYLIDDQAGCYEVRDIKVRVSMGETTGLPYEYLVFVMNNEGLIVSSHFAMETHHYREIIKQGVEIQDIVNRNKILHFLESYRTAYNKKNLGFIDTTLSEDALIIVGYIVKYQKSDLNYLENKSFLNKQQINFIRRTKVEYLEKLKQVFRQNDFIRVTFDEVEIVRHHNFQEIYGVKVKQRWNSSTYRDEGYLFLMVDFVKPDEPIIRVRSWQPEKFEDGSTINLYDFKIIN